MRHRNQRGAFSQRRAARTVLAMLTAPVAGHRMAGTDREFVRRELIAAGSACDRSRVAPAMGAERLGGIR
jgi:hypothetical protein